MVDGLGSMPGLSSPFLRQGLYRSGLGMPRLYHFMNSLDFVIVSVCTGVNLGFIGEEEVMNISLLSQ